MYKSKGKRLTELEERVDILENKSHSQIIKIEVTTSNANVGDNIKVRRQALGLTQENLADALGLSRSMIAQIERGSKVPNVMLGRDIARILQCSLDDLVEKEA